MSPDSDAVKWLVVVATLVQTVTTVAQAQQRQQADGSAAVPMTSTLKLALVSSVLSTLWLVGFRYLHERHTVEGVVLYTIRDEFEKAKPLQALLLIGAAFLPGLGCWAVVSITKAMVISDLDMSRIFVYVVALVASIVSLFVAVAQTYAASWDDPALWIVMVCGALAGLDTEKE
ncbi:hypothetical protein ACWEV3_04465 [Saccharopolyspora sp. NPDC003752]